MEWSNVANQYQKLLKSALNVRRQALHISQIKAAGVSTQLIVNLTNGSDVVQRQLDRLEKNEFRIAVVGLEKSGKSTFVNAWLETDLLPTASKRCTFTTTQIYSVSNQIDQRLDVLAKTKDEFNIYIGELEQVASGTGESAKRAKEDLDTIKQNRNSLDSVVREGNKTLKFINIEEILVNLKKYVADVTVAHAINEVRLYTDRLAETDGIVFFDVPGLNSGLGKHLEESRSMLADCDAVICIQNSRHPSLESHEQKLVDFVVDGDEAVGVAGKLFVFAGQADLHGSADSLDHDLREIQTEWNKRGKLPQDHIVIGSSAAYLLFKGAASDELYIQVGKPEDMRRKLASVKRIDEPYTDDDLIQSTGIPVIRNRIKRYLNEERSIILRKRCDEPIKRIMANAREVFATVSRNFSENPDEMRRLEANKINIKFQEWWDTRWNNIEPSVNRYFKEHFEVGPNSENMQSVVQLKERYQQLVREGLTNLPSLKDDRIQDIFDKTARPVFDALIANDTWRGILYDNDITKFLHDLAEKLSNEFIKDTQSFVNFMTENLWGSLEVKKYMIDENQLKLQVESGLRALFLRFARPVAEALIRGPLASDRRKEIVKNLGYDIELLDNYYDGEDKAFSTLKRFVKYGQALINDPIVRQVVLNISPIPATALSVVGKTLEDVKPKPATTSQEVIDEVKGDIEVLEKYLIDLVFKAAGIASYFSQEMKRLRDHFASSRATWTGVAINEYESENPLLMKELPEELKQPSFDIEISECLRQLRLSIEDATVKGI